jgi:hypothetical protein
MRILRDLPARAFAVVVDKRNKEGRAPDEIFDMAWEGLLQRLERTSNKEGSTFIVLHDEGENDKIRRWVRQARRYLTAGSAFGTGSMTFAASLLVDDPMARRSDRSYLIQTADLVAYAGFAHSLLLGKELRACAIKTCGMNWATLYTGVSQA